MASLTIRNLDNNLKVQLRLRAARHGCSMEAEVRTILTQTLNMPETEQNLAAAIHRRFESLALNPCRFPRARQSVTRLSLANRQWNPSSLTPMWFPN